MTIDADRALRAFTDVLAVEWGDETGVARVVTLSDVYHAVPEEGQHLCPDREYHDVAMCKHLVALEAVRGRLDIPDGWFVTDDLDERTDESFDVTTDDDPGLPDFDEFRGGSGDPPLVTDGGGWVVRDPERDNERTFDTRAAAEDAAGELRDLGADVELVSPGDAPEPDGGNAAVEVVDEPEPDPDIETETADDALPERSVADDPLNWVPGEFVDEIDGTQAINRKGFEVLSHFYDVDVHAEVQVPPEETDFEFCRVKATATTDDRRECEAFGSAHVDRDDDPWLLLEMADTRARKRALSIATGVGAVAVAELKNEVGDA
jgi:hypothetical protein